MKQLAFDFGGEQLPHQHIEVRYTSGKRLITCCEQGPLANPPDDWQCYAGYVEAVPADECQICQRKSDQIS